MRRFELPPASLGKTVQDYGIVGSQLNEHSARVQGGWRDDPRESPGGGMTGAGLRLIDAFVNIAGPMAAVDARVHPHKRAPYPRDETILTVARNGERPGTRTFPQVDSLAVLLEARRPDRRDARCGRRI
jgi:hypothetical protein